MPGKPKNRVSKKQVQIIETAKILFMRHGIKRVTIEEICRTANVSKMTFYKYYANKAALVTAIWDAWIEEGFGKFDEINALDIPFPEKIQRMFEWKRELLSKMHIEFIDEYITINPEQERIKKRFLNIVIEAQKKGDVRKEIHPEFFMAVLDKLYELAFDDNLREHYESITDFQRELKDFFWYGVLTDSYRIPGHSERAS